jgi:hypothetical protein
MRWILVSCVLVGVGLVGCIPSERMAEGELDGYWVLAEDASQSAREYRPVVSGKQLPSRWTVQQGSSLIWSTVTIVRAMDKLATEPESISFSVSPEHTESVVEMLDNIREVLETLESLAKSAERGQTREWASLMAQTLVKIEQISRAVHVGAEGAVDGSEPALAAEPLLRMVAVYVNENSGGELLAGLGPEEIGGLRSLLTQIVLQIGFDLVGKQVEPELRHDIVAMMEGADALTEAEDALQDLLSRQLSEAPASTREAEAAGLIRGASKWGPRGIRFLQAFIQQWDRMDSIEMAFQKRDDDLVLTTTINVLPDEEVRLAEAVIFQPTIVFRGSSRMVIVPKHPQTGETIVSFEPVDGGAVEMEFVGLPYTAARLAGLPLASGAVRQVRVFTHSPKQGDRVIHAEVLMQASDDKTDPRRMMVYHDARQIRLARSAMAVDEVTDHSEQVVTYFTPTRRYTYRRTKGQDD